MDLALIKPNYECLDSHKGDCGVIAYFTKRTCLYPFIPQSQWVHLKYNLVCTQLSYNLSHKWRTLKWYKNIYKIFTHPLYHAHVKAQIKVWKKKSVIWFLLQNDQWSPGRALAVALQRCFSMHQRRHLVSMKQRLFAYWMFTFGKFQNARKQSF